MNYKTEVRVSRLAPHKGLKFEVDENWTVLDLKTKIEELTEIPSKDQILVGKSQVAGPSPWTDNAAMIETIFPIWATKGTPMPVSLWTKLIEPKMLKVPISIYHPKRAGDRPEAAYEQIEVEVESSASVKQLKMKIDEMKGIAPSRQKLTARAELPPHSKIQLLDSYRLKDVLPVGLNESYKLILKKTSRRRKTTAIAAVVPWMGISTTLNIDAASDTGFTLRAKIRKHVVPFLAESETFQVDLRLKEQTQFSLDVGSSNLSRYKIESVIVELNISSARAGEYLKELKASGSSLSNWTAWL